MQHDSQGSAWETAESTTAYSPPVTPPPSAPMQSRNAGAAARRHRSAVLVMRRGPDAGTRYPLNRDTTTLGRQRGCDIVLDDTSVSRNHAVISHSRGVFSIQDQRSLNGTYVNRKQVTATNLNDGDEIWLGRFRLTFHAPGLPVPN